MTFELTSAIRYDPQLLVDGKIANDSMYQCPDEGFACPGTHKVKGKWIVQDDCGCPFTAWVECAMNNTVSEKQKVNFLACWDEATIADKLQNETTLSAIVQDCSTAASIAFKDVQTCHSSQLQSDLLWSAANKFMTKWPNFTVMGGHFQVPHVLIGDIDGSDVEDMVYMEPLTLNASDIARLNDKLCELRVEGVCDSPPEVVV